MGVVVRRYIDFLILFIPTPLVSVLFLQQHPYFLFIFFKCFSFLYIYSVYSLCNLNPLTTKMIFLLRI